MLPARDSITRGGRIIPAGTVVAGSVATWGGALEIQGTVLGDAIAIDGDVIVASSGHVRGSVLSVQGVVRTTGVINGDVLRLEGNLTPVAPVTAPARVLGTWRTVGITLGTLGILLVLGIGVLIFAGTTLDGVVEALENQLARSFLLGLAGELGLIPGMLILVAVLFLTILGILLIPFAIVAYLLAAAGALTLGFLAVSVVIGSAIARWRRSRPLTSRATMLRALMLGVFALLAPWLLAAAVAWQPVVAAIARIVALTITWVAVTAGLGAVLISRAGTRRAEAPRVAVVPLDDIGWQTPTPVSGVAAARRPTPVVSGKGR
jgi:hypothetical protein